MQLNIPIWLTLSRVALIPFFILAFYLPFTWGPILCAIIFIFSALTDWFDGFLARRWQQTTRFGAFLDPVVDKVMIAVALALVVDYYHSWWVTLPAVTMIAREIVISSLREWMAEIGKRSSVAVSSMGKIKTTLQMISLIGLIWRPERSVLHLAFFLLYIAAALTFWSMLRYLKAACNDLIQP